MTVEIRKNTSLQILISPEGGLEVLILEEMATRAKANPLLLTMAYNDGIAVISVDLNEHRRKGP